jgi:hypothetical protein
LSIPFDIKRYEENKARTIRVRQLFRLPHDVAENVMHILTAGAQRSDLFQTCVTCCHFESLDGMGSEPPKERCKKFNILPPAKVIADGCKFYDFDDIPF